MTFSTGCLARAKEMISEKYLVSFKSNKSTCILRVNDLPAADSTVANLRTVSLGYNSTAYLENGKNKVELLMGPMNHKDPSTLYKNSSCTVVFSKNTEHSSEELAVFSLNVNEENKISAANSVNHTSLNYGKSIYEGYSKSDKDFGLYKAESELIVRGLPKWSWVHATPVTKEDLPKIRLAYEKIWKMMHERDVHGLESISRISLEELSYAEGISKNIIFMSTDLPQHVLNKELRPVPIDWGKYKLITYKDGRLFRMAVGFFQNSPLKFMDEKGTAVYAYSPYFSIINNNVVLVR